jgi:GntR family transcriptional regulator/MocR family aminotransferase
MQAPDGLDTTQLAHMLKDKGVLIEPGAPFFDGPNPPIGYFRLAYSSIPTARIPEGVALIAKGINALR